MQTKIYDLKKEFNKKDIKDISEIIKKGGLVAIPTETVYGLGADGLNKEAVRKIFKAKNRPMDNPLILHISDFEDIFRLTKSLNDKYIDILKELWPGPLTVILKKSDIIPDEISAGLDTVAIRMPKNDITREIIRKSNTALAAPSANLSTKPSPTSANEVFEDMNGRIDAIVDAGKSDIGIESTVLDLTEDIPTILRPGYYTKEMLEKYFKIVYLDKGLNNSNNKAKSPGQKYKHYAPNANVMVIVAEDEKFLNETKNLIKANKDKKIGIMAFEEDIKYFDNEYLISMKNKDNLEYMASILFESFRKMDNYGVELIIVRGVDEDGLGLSIMNRLNKAASGNIRRI